MSALTSHSIERGILHREYSRSRCAACSQDHTGGTMKDDKGSFICTCRPILIIPQEFPYISSFTKELLQTEIL